MSISPLNSPNAFNHFDLLQRIPPKIIPPLHSTFDTSFAVLIWSIDKRLADLEAEIAGTGNPPTAEDRPPLKVQLVTAEDKPPLRVKLVAAEKPKRTRKAKRSLGKGPQSDFKKQQRDTFARFLKRHPITPSVSAITRAHKCWLEHKAEWDAAANDGTGYSDHKKLARTV